MNGKIFNKGYFLPSRKILFIALGISTGSTKTWPFTKSGLQFAHATGFNALTYKEILEPLSEHFNIRAVDARGHGFTELKANPENMYDWKIY